MNQSDTNRITSQSFYHRIVVSCCRCEKELLPVYFLVSPDSIRPRRLHLEELNWLHFLETGGSVGNVVLSRCDTVPAALMSEDPWGPCFMRCDLREAWKHWEKMNVCVRAGKNKKCLVYLLTSFSQPGRYKPCLPSLPWPSGLFQAGNGFIWIYF